MYGKLIWILFFTQLALGQEQLAPESVLKEMVRYSDDYGTLLEKRKVLDGVRPSALLPLIPELIRLTSSHYTNANLRRHTADLLIRIAIEVPHQKATVLSIIRNLALTREYEEDRLDSREQSFVRTCLISSLSDGLGKAPPALRSELRFLLEEIGLSGLPGSDHAIRNLETVSDVSFKYFLQVATETFAYPYARAAALNAIRLAAKSKKFTTIEESHILRSLDSLTQNELAAKNPSEPILSSLLSLLGQFASSEKKHLASSLALKIYKANLFESDYYKRRIYETLVAFSDQHNVLNAILESEEKDASYGQHYQRVAWSQVLVIRDSDLSVTTKAQLWRELIEYLLVHSKTNDSWKRKSILEGMRLAFSIHICPQAFPEGSPAWKKLPDYARSLILIEVSTSRSSGSLAGALIIGLATGGAGFFVQPGTSQGSQSSNASYYNLRDDLIVDEYQANHLKVIIQSALARI